MGIPCIVCGAHIEAGCEVYANLWEASLKKHPCCGKACAERFHVDVHWIPGSAPAAVTDVLALQRRVENALHRLHHGEAPAGVVRSLLLAGVASPDVRGILEKVIADLEHPMEDRAAASSRRLTVPTNIFGIIVGFLTGYFFIAGTTGGSGASKADETAVRAAHSIVDAWERAFALPATRASERNPGAQG